MKDFALIARYLLLFHLCLDGLVALVLSFFSPARFRPLSWCEDGVASVLFGRADDRLELWMVTKRVDLRFNTVAFDRCCT